jgi:DNA-binding Lrp family transcriptional regulator
MTKMVVNCLHEMHVFVDIFVESQLMDEVVQALCKISSVEELYEVTGEFDIVTLIAVNDIEEFREVLNNKIMKIKGIRSAISTVIIQSHKGPLVKKIDPL